MCEQLVLITFSASVCLFVCFFLFVCASVLITSAIYYIIQKQQTHVAAVALTLSTTHPHMQADLVRFPIRGQEQEQPSPVPYKLFFVVSKINTLPSVKIRLAYHGVR